MIGDVPILSSALLGTERAFGHLVPARSKRVVIGGLGFGSTLRGVLETVGPLARVVVAEKLSTVVKLLRGELAHLAHDALDDSRVTLVRKDVRDVIASERDLDAILLDVDNGPEWAAFPENAALYDREGLRVAHAALRTGGVFAVWSGYACDDFLARLEAAGFRASIVTFEEKNKIQARAYVGKKI